MKTIQVDNFVYSALEKRIVGFEDTPNLVIKRLLQEVSADSKTVNESLIPNSLSKNIPPNPLVDYVRSPHYQNKDYIKRYLDILGFLYKKNPEEFVEKLDGFKCGRKRICLSQDEKIIESSGNSTRPQRLPDTPFFVMTTLDNKGKRSIIGDILRILKYDSEVISIILQSIPDSGIPRSKKLDISEYF